MDYPLRFVPFSTTGIATRIEVANQTFDNGKTGFNGCNLQGCLGYTNEGQRSCSSHILGHHFNTTDFDDLFQGINGHQQGLLEEVLHGQFTIGNHFAHGGTVILGYRLGDIGVLLCQGTLFFLLLLTLLIVGFFLLQPTFTHLLLNLLLLFFGQHIVVEHVLIIGQFHICQLLKELSFRSHFTVMLGGRFFNLKLILLLPTGQSLFLCFLVLFGTCFFELDTSIENLLLDGSTFFRFESGYLQLTVQVLQFQIFSQGSILLACHAIVVQISTLQIGQLVLMTEFFGLQFGIDRLFSFFFIYRCAPSCTTPTCRSNDHFGQFVHRLGLYLRFHNQTAHGTFNLGNLLHVVGHGFGIILDCTDRIRTFSSIRNVLHQTATNLFLNLLHRESFGQIGINIINYSGTHLVCHGCRECALKNALELTHSLASRFDGLIGYIGLGFFYLLHRYLVLNSCGSFTISSRQIINRGFLGQQIGDVRAVFGVEFINQVPALLCTFVGLADGIIEFVHLLLLLHIAELKDFIALSASVVRLANA